MQRTLLNATGTRLFLLVAVAIALLGIGLRAYHLSQRSLWFDEAIAANVSRGTFAQTVALTRVEHSAPLVAPAILYAVEKVTAGPLAVRTPSLVASVLAVILMLCFVTIPSVDPKIALLSSLMLSVSASQIRYAQEVREYSLCVLYATLLLYAFMSYVSNGDGRRPFRFLCLALFAAPLIQYGLALFSAGILASLLLLGLFDARRQLKIAQVMQASLCFAAGCLLSYVSTLRYQWGETPWYLQDYYLAPHGSILRFTFANTRHLLPFLLPGILAAAVSVIGVCFYTVTSVRQRRISPLLVLAVISLTVAWVAGIFRIYPYGGIRQCLFLAPVLCLLASTSLVDLASRFTGNTRIALFIALAGLIVTSGVLQIRSMKPFAEIEDIQKVLRTLQDRLQPGDKVYVYSGAVPAVDFYVRERDPRFIYGDFHRKTPAKYALEMTASLPPGTNTVWILFSHVYQNEDQRILQDLSNRWDVRLVEPAHGSALYRASRRPALAGALFRDSEAKDDVESGDSTHPSTASTQAPDDFWNWNVRNSRLTTR